MPSASTILNTLYAKVLKKSRKLASIEIEEKEKRDYNSGSSPFLKPDTADASYADDIAPTNKTYTTNRNIGDLPAGGGGPNAAPLPDNTSGEPFDYSTPSGEDDEEKQRKIMKTDDGEEFEIKEQDEVPVDPAEKEVDKTTTGDVDLPPDPATTNSPMNAQQPDAMGMGDVGAGLGPMGMEEEEEKSPHELGRIYELKKIYARLTSIESYLASEADTELAEIRKYVSQSIELFEILSSNIDVYTEKMDDIIISYYKFLKEIYNKIKIYYEDKSRRAKNG